MVKGKGKKEKNVASSGASGLSKKLIKKNFKKEKAPTTTTPLAEDAAASGSLNASDKNNAKDKIAGFIFMCNAQTKAECYQYRVFGLPKGKSDVVEKIKQGTKLFLYDFDLKLLYGIYKASSKGGLNLDSKAFRGKFPAQVKFKIVKDCLPLPESAFRHAILDNYIRKNKFNPELSFRQVQNLMSMFRPLNDDLPPTAPSRYVDREYVSPPRRFHSPDDRYRHPAYAIPPPVVSRDRIPALINETHPHFYGDRDPYSARTHHLIDPYRAPSDLPPSSVYQPASGFSAVRDPYYQAVPTRAYYPENLPVSERYREAPGRDYSSVRGGSEIFPSTGLVAPRELPPQENYWMPRYEDQNRVAYARSYGQVSATTDVPRGVSSRYTFAGAPAYR